MKRLTELESLPAGFLDAGVRDLHHILPPLSLLHLRGTSTETVLVSILLHGNETTGLTVVQQLLRECHGKMSRSLSLLVGNVDAAADGLRNQPGGSDFNRFWPDTQGRQRTGSAEERAMAAAVVRAAQQRKLCAVVDIHNNSGRNPPHACVNVLDDRTLGLGQMFSDLQLYFRHPPGTLSLAFADQIPTVTIECGMPGDAEGERRALHMLRALLAGESLPRATPEVRVYRSVATIRVPEGVRVGVNDASASVNLSADLDVWNWSNMPGGTAIAELQSDDGLVLEVRNAAGEDVSGYYLRRNENRLEAAKPLIPAMISLDTRIIRQDCLCYLLEPVFK